jgi:putative ABC transport system ATP-binding protein
MRAAVIAESTETQEKTTTTMSTATVADAPMPEGRLDTPPPDGSRHALCIRDLQHYFGEGELRKQALFDNNLEVAPGEIVIMTGPSGSGKTTLLTLIGTLRTVQQGSVEVLGSELHGASDEQRIAVRRQLGFIFQHHNLFASLTALQNVRMGLELFGVPPAEIDRQAVEILTRVGLGARINYMPEKLSGGQKQRVAIARALAHGPRLVLADEPTAALDGKAGREVVGLFQELAHSQGCTVLMVTHDNRVLDIADRIVNMVDGRIVSSVLVQESALICEFLKDCHLFAPLTLRTLSYVADKMRLEVFAPGAVVIRQGDPGDKFYLIRSGAVDVVREDAAGQKSIAKLGRGDFFGETALLTGERRNSTVRAAEKLEVYALMKNDFEAVVMSSASFEEELRKALFARH